MKQEQVLELDKDYKGRFCMCCGRKNEKIWHFLMKQPWIDMKGTIGHKRKEWKGHKFYEGNQGFGERNYFYDTNELNYCSNCGEKLDEEFDIHGVNEGRGEFWGAPCSEYVITGYHCHSCDYEEEF